MDSMLNLTKIIVEKCKAHEWDLLLTILKETQIAMWFSGKEKYEDFYSIKYENEIIGCFTFSFKGETGILKNLAIAKKFQRKGIGSYIANNIVPYVAKDLGIKDLYLHGNDRGVFTSNYFWEKTKFKFISSSEVKDKYYLDYFNFLVSNYSEKDLCKESVFYMDLREL